MKQTIFYSWQSDLPQENNKNAIRQALNTTIAKFDSLQLELDEATRNMSGSPSIPKTIFAKINNCDIFVCDLTTINRSSSCGKKVPNPNVLIELGYAVAKLGWSRIIMLFNTEFGTFPNDMPFDIDRHRASKYSIKGKDDKAGKNNLNTILEEAIKIIIKENPVKEFEKTEESDENKKRRLDITNLKWIMGSFDLKSFDLFIRHMPKLIIHRISYFEDSFASILDSSSFHLYDKILLKHLEILKQNLAKSLSFEEHYEANSSGNGYIFHKPMDIFPSDKSEKDYQALTNLRNELKKNMKDLLDYIRNNYIEIDLEETSKIAFENYKKHIAEK